MAQTVWKGELAFDGISMPVKLVAAARTEKIEFSMVNPETGNGISQRTVDAGTGEEVRRADLVKAARLDDGRTVYVTEEDLKGIKVPSSSTMKVLSTVRVVDVDPVFFDSSYYVLPDGKVGDQPYHVIRQALGGVKAGALVKITRGQRESLALIRPSGDTLMLHTLFYDGEVRSLDEREPVVVEESYVRLARSFVRASLREFAPEFHRDAYRDALTELLEQKVQPGGDLRDVLKSAIKKARTAKKEAKS